MEAGRNDVIVLAGTGGNDAINGLMRAVAVLIERSGFRIHFFDMSRVAADDLQRLADVAVRGTTAFAVSFLGIAQELELSLGGQVANAWERAGIPFIKLHGDIPAYFIERHGDLPATGVNAYYFDEHLACRRALLPDARSSGAVIDPFIISDVARSTIDFAARARGKLVFVKNGGDPQALMSSWVRQLPESISDQLIELALDAVPRALKPGRFLLHEHVSGALAELGIDAGASRRLLRLYVAQLDDYIRRVKANLVAKTMLRFPVVIQGSGWDHLDRSGAKAELAPPMDFEATESVFRSALGVVDMSPNVDGGHDRMWRAAGTYAYGLVNKSSWLERLCPALNAHAYEFEEASVAAAVDRALTHPRDCVELAQAYGEAFRRRYSAETWVDRLVTLADIARLQCGAHEPALQPYFVW